MRGLQGVHTFKECNQDSHMNKSPVHLSIEVASSQSKALPPHYVPRYILIEVVIEKIVESHVLYEIIQSNPVYAFLQQ